MYIGYDALKKVNDFFGKYCKQSLPTKKYQEVLLMLEEFLYTRELPPAKLTFNFRPPEAYYSSKKMADCEQLNKFSHLSSDLEINLIVNIPLKYAKKHQVTERENDFIELLNRNFSAAQYELPPQELVQKNRAFKYKTVMIEQKKYTHQKLPPKLPASSLTAQKQQLQQYMSISSNDVQMMQKRLQMLQQKNPQAPNELAMKPVNLLGEEVANQQHPQQQQRPSIKSNSVAQKPVKMETDNNLLDLEYEQKNHPNGSPVKQNQQLPHDLVFTQQKNLEIINITNNTALPNNQIHLNLTHQHSDPMNLSTSPVKQVVEVQVKMVEKMALLQKDGKLKEIKMHGQITLEGTCTDDQASLQLLGKNWNDQHGCPKRITPNSLPIAQTKENAFVQSQKK